MTKYEIVSTERVEKPPSGDVVVELKFELNGGNPTVLARTPGGKWNKVCWLDRDGELGLSVYAKHTEGLNCNSSGEIITF